jgi:hypothetical protein
MTTEKVLNFYVLLPILPEVVYNKLDMMISKDGLWFTLPARQRPKASPGGSCHQKRLFGTGFGD